MKAPLQVLSRVVFACAIPLANCSGGDDATPPAPPRCVENLNTNCMDVLYSPPLYSTIFSKIIQPQCALSVCHSLDSAMGGLVLANADDAYDALLGLKGGTKRVLPNDATCSPLMVRLESRDPKFVMPPGMRLSEQALCDFVQWIQLGAQHN